MGFGILVPTQRVVIHQPLSRAGSAPDPDRATASAHA